MNVNEIPYPSIQLLQCVATDEPRNQQVSIAQSINSATSDSIDLLEQLVTVGLLEIAGRNRLKQSC